MRELPLTQEITANFSKYIYKFPPRRAKYMECLLARNLSILKQPIAYFFSDEEILFLKSTNFS